MLPKSGIWIGHFQSALVLIFVAIAYPIYMCRAALVPRIRLDAIRLRELLHNRYRWATVNVVLNWACYLTVLTELLTGGLLYFDRGHAIVVQIHWLAADSDEAARVNRNDAAQDSEMISPGIPG